jgi:hypothetical protein
MVLTDLCVGVKILLRWTLKKQSACALDIRHSHILLNLKIHYCALKGSLNSAHTDEPYLSKIYFCTIIPLLPWFPCSLIASVFETKVLHVFPHFACAVCTSRSYHTYRDKAKFAPRNTFAFTTSFKSMSIFIGYAKQSQYNIMNAHV